MSNLLKFETQACHESFGESFGQIKGDRQSCLLNIVSKTSYHHQFTIFLETVNSLMYVLLFVMSQICFYHRHIFV